MKIALVHDYLFQDGGAERVLKALHTIWSDAPIFVLFNKKGSVAGFEAVDMRESFLSYMPFGKTKYQWYMPWMPFATERHNLNDFDVVLSSSSAFAKGVLTRPKTMHISYCHTPTRYLWTDTHQYIADLPYNKIVKAFLPWFVHRMRLWDNMSVDRVDHFVANSNTVRGRILKYYRRESDIIYPPVDVEHFFISKDIGDYFVSGGRLVSYKRFDLLVQVFNRLSLPLKIFGDGPARESLQAKAKRNIEFLGRITDKEKAILLSRARAFIHPQVEDFGITPIESMASGRPVIAYGDGGATETVVPGHTGILFYHQSWEDILDQVIHFDPDAWDSDAIRAYAFRFSESQFKDRITRYVTDRYEEFQQGLRQCRLDVR